MPGLRSPARDFVVQPTGPVGYKPRVRFLGLVLVVGGCGFSVAGAPPTGEDAPDVDAGVDAPSATPVDAAPDAPPPLPLYAASNQMLHRIDIDAKTAAVVGPIAEAGGSSFDVDGLALLGAQLIGLSPGGAELITIDPASAAVTQRRAITPAGPVGGLTVAPAGSVEAGPVVFAGGDYTLRRIDPATGVVTTVGLFGADLRFFSDLAWVEGQGLYATLHGGVCASICFAKIDPATGTATVFRSNLTSNLYGLSGYRGRLWAFHHDGPVLTVRMTDGLLDIHFDPLIAWTEAAQ